jgi:predicted esterase
MLRPCLFLMGACGLLFSCGLRPSVSSSVQIPHWEGGAGPDWPERAYQVEVLSPASPTDPANPAKLALAWSEEGLLVWIEMKDATPQEAETPSSLWQKDSVELFVASPAGSANRLQFLCAPGHDPAHPAPRWSYVSEKKDLEPPVVEARVLEGGYRLFARLPWSVLGSRPAEGDSLGVQVYVNDAFAENAKNRYLWFPSEKTNSDPSACRVVRLGRQASAPESMTARIEVEKLAGFRLRAAASPALEGAALRLRKEGETSWKAVGRLEASGSGVCTAVVSLPRGLEDQAGKTVEIRAGSGAPVLATVPDLRAARQEALRRARVAAKPAIFSGVLFPPIEFVEKELAAAAFGDCAVKVRYFNRDFEEVTRADRPGRYGAWVEIETADGLKAERRLTLFRTAGTLNRRRDSVAARLEFPAVFGLPAGIGAKEQNMVGDFMNGRLYAAAESDDRAAQLPAALMDIAEHPGEWEGLDAATMDQDWWSRLEKKLGTGKPYARLVQLPKDYEADPAKKWPLLLFLHGSGERGSDLERVKVHGPLKLAAQGRDFPFVVVAPQCPEKVWWSPVLLDDLVEQICADYRIDRSRLYVTGLSMGGYGTWSLIGRYPDKYAAAVPICGGALPALAPKIKDIPIWVFHGGQDDTVPLESSTGIVSAMEKQGGHPKLTVYPGVGHNSWTQAYEDPALYAWLLQQHK